MATTRLQAKQYIARALGAEGSTVQLAAAQDALFAAIEEWNLKRDWQFLLMDTTDGFSVAACTGTGTTLDTTTSNGFIGVNPGQTVSGTGITVGTTVSSITDNDTIVLSAASTSVAATITFSGDIPLVVGTTTYNLPTPFKRPYTARVVSGDERTLDHMDQRLIDRMYQDQNTNGRSQFYNLMNKATFDQSRQNGKLRLFPPPSAIETVRVRYYRPIAQPSGDSVNLDLPDRYIYALLELGRWHYLKNHDSETERLSLTQSKANELYTRCAADDEGVTEDREVVLVSQIDHAQSHIMVSDELWWP